MRRLGGAFISRLLSETTMKPRFLYLDTFASVQIASDSELAAQTKNYIANEGFTLVVGVMNLIELFSWSKRWPEFVSFVSSVPFCIVQNLEEVAAAEIASYPNELTCLPVGFSSAEHSFSEDELRDALSIHLKGKVSGFSRNFRGINKETFQSVLDNRILFPPEKAGKYTPAERWMFLQSSVLKMLCPTHQDFFKRVLSSGEEINIERFKSVYIQALAIFAEYYVQKKPGKVSDIGDIYQLGLVPYVDLAVLDIERNNLIQRFNREGLFPGSLRTCSISDFKAKVSKASVAHP